jgi:hypothetical protein
VLGVEFAAQAGGVRIQGAGLRGAAVGPDAVQQLFLGEDAHGVRGEDAEEGELFFREVDLAIADRDPAAQRVDDEVADAAGAVLGMDAAAEHGADAGAQLGVAERLAFQSFVWPDPDLRLGLALDDETFPFPPPPLQQFALSRGWEQVSSSPAMADFENECFFIAPIGEDSSEVRKRSDGVRDWVVKPAAKAAAELTTVRADDVGEPGQITAQAVQHCLKAKAAVADLTGGNPNVYYELSVRHGALLPVVLIAEEGTKLPFDISQSRVIFFDHTNLSSAGQAKEELQAQIEASLSGTPDNPISDGMRLAELQAGNAEEQTLAAVLDRLQRLSHTTEQIDQRLARTEQNTMIMRGISRRPIRGRVVEGPVQVRPTGRVILTEDGDQIEQREYVPPVDVSDDLSDEEKADILAEVEDERRLRHPQSDPHGDPEADT